MEILKLKELPLDEPIDMSNAYILDDVRNVVLYTKQRNLYYFDSDYIWSCLTLPQNCLHPETIVEKANLIVPDDCVSAEPIYDITKKSYNKDLIESYRADFEAHPENYEKFFETIIKPVNPPDILLGVKMNKKHEKKILSRLSVGNTIVEFIYCYNLSYNYADTPLQYIQQYIPYRDIIPYEGYRIITGWHKLSIERATDNLDKHTFDFIRIRAGLLSEQAEPNRLTILEKYKTNIVNLALQKIAKYSSYQAYHVPINFLKPSRMTITYQDELELLFELKTV